MCVYVSVYTYTLIFIFSNQQLPTCLEWSSERKNNTCCWDLEVARHMPSSYYAKYTPCLSQCHSGFFPLSVPERKEKRLKTSKELTSHTIRSLSTEWQSAVHYRLGLAPKMFPGCSWMLLLAPSTTRTHIREYNALHWEACSWEECCQLEPAVERPSLSTLGHNGDWPSGRLTAD